MTHDQIIQQYKAALEDKTPETVGQQIRLMTEAVAEYAELVNLSTLDAQLAIHRIIRK